MRVSGIILLIVGVLLMVATSFGLKTGQTSGDASPADGPAQNQHDVGWPVWAGSVAVLAGLVLIIAGRKK